MDRGPILGVLLFATILGIPTAVTIWLLVLSLLGLFGFIVAGIRAGKHVTARGGEIGHPYLTPFIGLVLLMLIGAIPVVGPVVVAGARFVGSGALALHALSGHIRNQPQPA